MTYIAEKPQATSATANKDPLTTRDRRIIASIVNSSDYPYQCEPAHVITIWINSDDIVWVKMAHGYARFNKEPFRLAVAEVKQSLPETALERNERLSEELETACTKLGLTHGQIDWVSFSTTLYMNQQRIGLVGCNIEDKWYARRGQYGASQQALNALSAIALLGVRAAAA